MKWESHSGSGSVFFLSLICARNDDIYYNEVKMFLLPAEEHLFIMFNLHSFLFLSAVCAHLFQGHEGKKAAERRGCRPD